MLNCQFSIDDLEEFFHYKNLLEKQLNMMGDGTQENPFKIKIDSSIGQFFSAKQLFKQGYPKFIKPHNCHTNSYKFAKFFNKDCEVLFGICHADIAFIHSVLKINDYILDFNYDLVMSENLYNHLFNFKVLNTIKSEDIKKYNSALENYVAENHLTITDGEVNACFYELVNQTHSKTE